MANDNWEVVNRKLMIQEAIIKRLFGCLLLGASETVEQKLEQMENLTVGLYGNDRDDTELFFHWKEKIAQLWRLYCESFSAIDDDASGCNRRYRRHIDSGHPSSSLSVASSYNSRLRRPSTASSVQYSSEYYPAPISVPKVDKEKISGSHLANNKKRNDRSSHGYHSPLPSSSSPESSVLAHQIRKISQISPIVRDDDLVPMKALLSAVKKADHKLKKYLPKDVSAHQNVLRCATEKLPSTMLHEWAKLEHRSLSVLVDFLEHELRYATSLDYIYNNCFNGTNDEGQSFSKAHFLSKKVSSSVLSIPKSSTPSVTRKRSGSPIAESDTSNTNTTRVQSLLVWSAEKALEVGDQQTLQPLSPQSAMPQFVPISPEQFHCNNLFSCYPPTIKDNSDQYHNNGQQRSRVLVSVDLNSSPPTSSSSGITSTDNSNLTYDLIQSVKPIVETEEGELLDSETIDLLSTAN